LRFALHPKRQQDICTLPRILGVFPDYTRRLQAEQATGQEKRPGKGVPTAAIVPMVSTVRRVAKTAAHLRSGVDI
jgi:hypothetical protein